MGFLRILLSNSRLIHRIGNKQPVGKFHGALVGSSTSLLSFHRFESTNTLKLVQPSLFTENDDNDYFQVIFTSPTSIHSFFFLLIII